MVIRFGPTLTRASLPHGPHTLGSLSTFEDKSCNLYGPVYPFFFTIYLFFIGLHVFLTT